MLDGLGSHRRGMTSDSTCNREGGPPPGRAARLARLVATLTAAALLACGGGGGDAPASGPCSPPAATAVDGPGWFGFGRDAQHSALGAVATQSLGCIFWQAPVDLAPQLTNGDLLTHYGSPVITRQNTVIVPVKTTATGGFRVEARGGNDGTVKWSMASDYRLPAHRWIPSFNAVLAAPATAGAPVRLVMPGSGGRLLVRDDPDADTGATSTRIFYDYAAAPTTFDNTVFINTPLVADSQGNVYFGFSVSGPNPANLSGGFARIAANGTSSWVSAAAASGQPAFVKPQTNSAPALSLDESTLYVVANTSPVSGIATGRLLALDAATLQTRNAVTLLDPATGASAWVSDDSTASPTVGPDGDVFVGVLESNAPGHHFRGWLLHFNAALTQTRTPGSFGWDDTASIVPRTMVPSYTGSSSYLLLTKYNNYGGSAGGDGRNLVAVLDPGQSQDDAITPRVPVMKEILTKLGPTADPEFPPAGVKEWCINTAAVDPLTSSVLINSEDGVLYRWHLPSDTFSERIALNSGRAQSYTPTAIGPDGRVYAINNAVLHSIGR